MGWALVLTAAILEILWASLLKHANSLASWSLVFVLILSSFLLLIKAYKLIPVGIAYAVFVGLGTVGTYFVSIYFFDESLSIIQFVFLLLLIIGIIGLKFTTREVKK